MAEPNNARVVPLWALLLLHLILSVSAGQIIFITVTTNGMAERDTYQK